MTAQAIPHRPVNILFLCTHNSARSILAEGLTTKLGKGRVVGYSAGSRPCGSINPHALRTLRQRGCAVSALRSKSWEEFVQPGAIAMHVVVTVCDNAAREACPVWPGSPVTANWACSDPSAASSDEAATALAFRRTADLITCRLKRLLQLPLDTMSLAKANDALSAIAQEIPEADSGQRGD